LPDDEILLSVVPATAFLGQMRAGNPAAAAGTYIDLGTRLCSMLKSVSTVTQHDLDTVAGNFQAWATEHVVNP
jgi:hypothetical protein